MAYVTFIFGLGAVLVCMQFLRAGNVPLHVTDSSTRYPILDVTPILPRRMSEDSSYSTLRVEYAQSEDGHEEIPGLSEFSGDIQVAEVISTDETVGGSFSTPGSDYNGKVVSGDTATEQDFAVDSQRTKERLGSIEIMGGMLPMNNITDGTSVEETEPARTDTGDVERHGPTGNGQQRPQTDSSQDSILEHLTGSEEQLTDNTSVVVMKIEDHVNNAPQTTHTDVNSEHDKPSLVSTGGNVADGETPVTTAISTGHAKPSSSSHTQAERLATVGIHTTEGKVNKSRVFPSTFSTDDSPPSSTTEEIAQLNKFIKRVLANGAPSQQKYLSPPLPDLHLHAVNIEYNISSADFRKRYGSTYAVQPVVLRDSQTDWLDVTEWDMAALNSTLKGVSMYDTRRQACRPGTSRRHVRECHYVKERDPTLTGKEWAALAAVNLEPLNITTYDELFSKQVELAKSGRYLYAHEIPCKMLPQLGHRLYQPKYFMNNFDDITMINNPDPDGLMKETHFPSFFFGPRGSASPLHSDAGMTRFWILQLAGRKLVRLLPPSENSKAQPTDEDLFQPSLFTADLIDPDFSTHPSLDGAIVYEAVLEPGDILHIPEGWAHQALNLEWSAMVSTNYVDDMARSNVANYFTYDEPEEQPGSTLELYHFYLPLVNASRDHGNIPMHEYFGSHALEIAEVSDAAKAHVHLLKSMGIEPDDWCDSYSRSLLPVAVGQNYLKLAKWLVEQGMSIDDGDDWREIHTLVQGDGHEKMAQWLLEQIESSDKNMQVDTTYMERQHEVDGDVMMQSADDTDEANVGGQP